MITGIISGMGAFAGTNLLREINCRTARKHGNGIADSDFPEILLHQVPFTASTHLGSVDAELFQERIVESATALKSLGVERLAFACNTHDITVRNIVATIDGMKYHSIRASLRDALLNHPGEEYLFLGSEHLVRHMDFTTYPGKSFSFPDQRAVNHLIHKSIGGRMDTNVFEELVVNHPEKTIVLGCTELYPYYRHNNRDTIDSIVSLAERIAP